MDPSGTTHPPSTVESLVAALEAQAARLTGLESQLDGAFSELLRKLSRLETRLPVAAGAEVGPSPSPAPVPVVEVPGPLAPEPVLASPQPFSGNFDRCRGFLLQVDLILRHQPRRYPTDGSRIGFVVSLLQGRALDWATNALVGQSPFSSDYEQFLTEFRAPFDHPPRAQVSSARLHSLQQGRRSVADYTLEFRTLAAGCRWGEEALMSSYRLGLADEILDGILREQPDSLGELIAVALAMDQRLLERREQRTLRPSRATEPSRARALSRDRAPDLPPAVPEPMELGRSRLSATERERRFRENLCLYCGASGHVIKTCPLRPKDRAH